MHAGTVGTGLGRGVATFLGGCHGVGFPLPLAAEVAVVEHLVAVWVQSPEVSFTCRMEDQGLSGVAKTLIGNFKIL